MIHGYPPVPALAIPGGPSLPGNDIVCNATCWLIPAFSLGGMFARGAPGAYPAPYLCIMYPISSPKFILT